MPVDDAGTLAALDALIAKIGAAGAVAVKGAALIVQRQGMENSPVLSGTLRRSWKSSSEGLTAFTGPTVIYARRIELGFRGTDSAGRTYNQAPNPYVKPARDQSMPAVRAFIGQTLADAMRR